MTVSYFEDVKVGDVKEFGRKEVTRKEILEFAEKYDPQPFHLDEQAAKENIYGDIIASGWHTGCMLMRMMVDNMVNDRAGLGSPGFDNLRWIKPVRPGDVLRARSEVFSARQSESRPDMGIVRSNVTVFNQNDEAVLSMETTGMVKTRPTD
jgi:acyl dehydratase